MLQLEGLRPRSIACARKVAPIAPHFAAVGLVVLSLGASSEPRAGTCMDVTTYDYNWGNDMKCKRQDGTTFYTSYSGAASFEAQD